jgi:hypothetical protein
MFLPVVVLLVLFSQWPGPVVHGQTSSNSLVGSWNATINAPDGSSTFPILLTFHADGTAALVFPGFGDGVGVGAWAQTGDGQFTMTTVSFDQNPPPDKNPLNGYLKIRSSFTVSGNTLSGTGESIQTDTAGSVVDVVTGATITATQIAVEQIGALQGSVKRCPPAGHLVGSGCVK